jgi:protein-tyrosine phosphatase
VKKICFVCLGNIVRSPLAEAIFNQKMVQMGLSDKYAVDSAAIGDWHVGERPDQRMRRVAARKGLVYDHRGRQIRKSDLDMFDLIVAMDRDNRSALYQITRGSAEQHKIRLLREFDPQGGPNAAVPDPYYGGLDGFEEVYRIVERSVEGLLLALENGELDFESE